VWRIVSRVGDQFRFDFRKKEGMKKLIGCACVLVLSFFAIRPLFSNGYFPMHDDTQVARVVVMGKALKQGQFPVRWVSDLGYGFGYPIFNFYGPLPYYVGGGLYALGVDSVVATKTMFAIGMVLAPVALFLLVELLFGFLAGITAGTLFMYAPYHAVQLYVRGSVGEYWSIAFVPLFLYGLVRSFKKKQELSGIIIGGMSLAAVIVSHTIMGFVTCFFTGIGCIVYWLVLLMQKKLRSHLVIVSVKLLLFGLGLSAFFWLPAAVEMSATSVSQMVGSASTTFFDHFVCANQLWNFPWGFAGSAPGCVDGMSFKLGKVQILLFALSFIAWIIFRKNRTLKQKNTVLFLSSVGVVVFVFLMLQISSPVWRLIPFTQFIQYPWRLLSFVMMFIAVGGAYIVSVVRIPIIRIGLTAAIVILTITVNTKIFVPQYIYVRDSLAFESLSELRFTKSKISDEYLPPGIIKPVVASEVLGTVVQGSDVFLVRAIGEQDTSFYAEIDSSAAQTITIRKAWFPGWKMTVGGIAVNPSLEKGFPTVNIPAGMSIIRMQFTNTLVRTIGNTISICTVVLLGVIYVYRKKTNA
jgi:hypothetical protein